MSQREYIFRRSKKDFKIETFRCGGPGGQNQNKRDTGVRIIDIETGLVAESRVHRTQHQNKNEAFYKMVELLNEYYIDTSDVERFRACDKIVRTYNEPDNRVLDHDTRETYQYTSTVGKGDISDLIDERCRLLAASNPKK